MHSQPTDTLTPSDRQFLRLIKYPIPVPPAELPFDVNQKFDELLALLFPNLSPAARSAFKDY